MTGVSWRPPWRRPGARGEGAGGAGRALGGGAAERLGGRRRPVKVTDSRERRPGEPSSGRHRPGGRRRDGGGPMKTSEGLGSICLHVRHIALKIKMRVRKYYYSNYVLEYNVVKLFIENLGSQKCGRHLFTSRSKLLTLVKSYDTTQGERFKSYHMFVSVLS